MAGFKVKPLVNLAFKALFEEIFSYLKLGQDVNNFDQVSPVISLKQKVANIRDKLDEFLVSTFSEVRKKLIVEFVNGRLFQDLKQVSSEVCLAFFDSVLDCSFKECDVSSHALATQFPDLNKLLEVLSTRSSDLASINLRADVGMMTEDMGGNCVQLLKNFNNLTSLSMEWTTLYDCLNFFSQLGDSCPKLTQLHLDNFYFDTPQLFALMFGQKHSLIPKLFTQQKYGPQNTMHLLEFEQQDLSPICSSLQELTFNNFCSIVNFDFRFWTDASSMAFVLRHFRNLQQLNHHCMMIHQDRIGGATKIWSTVIELLHDTTESDGRDITKMTFASEPLGVIKVTINAPFKGIIYKLEIHFN